MAALPFLLGFLSYLSCSLNKLGEHVWGPQKAGSGSEAKRSAYIWRVKKAEVLTVNKCEHCQSLPLLLKLITRKCKQKRGTPPPPTAPVMVPQGLGTLF